MSQDTTEPSVPPASPLPSSRPRVRDDLSALEGYHSPQVEADIRLNTNEAPGPPAPGFTEAVADAVRAIQWHRYPDREGRELRTRIGALHGRGPEQIFVANGSNEVLQTVLLTFGGAGRQVLSFEPTYALHSHLARITGATSITGERTEGFQIDPEYAQALIRRERPAVVFVCSPNNPTGIVEDRATVLALLDAVAEVGALLVVDEAYGQFAPWSAEELLGDDVPLVVSRTYSKTWAMAAARLGYLLGPAWIVDELFKVVLPYHLDTMKQAAGIAALDFLDDMNARVATIVEERGTLYQGLLDLGFEVWPSGANFLLLRPPGGGDAQKRGDAFWSALLERSILIRNTAGWDHIEGTLRVTVGTPEENRTFLAAAADIIEGGGLS